MYDVWGIPIDLAPLVRILTEKAYQEGARFVDVLWNDESLQLIRFQSAAHDTFKEYPVWRADVAYDSASAGDAILVFYGQDPDLLIDQDPSLISAFLDGSMDPMKGFSDLRRRNATNCCLFSAPIPGWSDKVFPDLAPDQRLEALWNAIFDVCRVKSDDPVSEWRSHFQKLEKICTYLNQKNYTSLIFTGPRTELHVGLVDKHVWKSGSLRSQNGIDFAGNLPTEEVFTLPHRQKVDGVVSATKPLSFGGAQIEELVLTFEAGRVTKAQASMGENFLLDELGRDEGASFLGEVALVPHSSPISRSDLTFHNILFDENASSHLALGAGFRFNMLGGEDLNDDEFQALGGNISNNHLDFMIGSEMINVDGEQDGEIEPIMRDGEWVIL
jgi:aminopeptidase